MGTQGSNLEREGGAAATIACKGILQMIHRDSEKLLQNNGASNSETIDIGFEE